MRARGEVPRTRPAWPWRMCVDGRTVSNSAKGAIRASRASHSARSAPLIGPASRPSSVVSAARTASAPTTSRKTVRSPPERTASGPSGILSSHAESAPVVRRRSHVSWRVKVHSAVSQYASLNRTSPTVRPPHASTATRSSSAVPRDSNLRSTSMVLPDVAIRAVPRAPTQSARAPGWARPRSAQATSTPATAGSIRRRASANSG